MNDSNPTSAQRTGAAYFRALFDAGRHGDAREESFYGPLAALVGAIRSGTVRNRVYPIP